MVLEFMLANEANRRRCWHFAVIDDPIFAKHITYQVNTVQFNPVEVNETLPLRAKYKLDTPRVFRRIFPYVFKL